MCVRVCVACVCVASVCVNIGSCVRVCDKIGLCACMCAVCAFVESECVCVCGEWDGVVVRAEETGKTRSREFGDEWCCLKMRGKE